jgi:hypothetical protein
MCCEARSRAAAVSYASVRPGFQKTRAGHGQENAPPRTAGMGAVTLTAHPVFRPRRPATAPAPRPPGVMTQVSGSMAPTDGKPLRDRWRGTADFGTSKPGCHTGDSRRLRRGVPETGRAAADPVNLVTQGGRPRCALMPVAEMRTLPMLAFMHSHALSSMMEPARLRHCRNCCATFHVDEQSPAEYECRGELVGGVILCARTRRCGCPRSGLRDRTCGRFLVRPGHLRRPPRAETGDPASRPV